MSIALEEAVKYLSILEMNPNQRYSPKEFKNRWRELCKRYHPDKHSESAYREYNEKREEAEKNNVPYTGDIILTPTEAEAKFKEVTHAYKMLTDRHYAMEHSLGSRHPAIDLDVQIPLNISFDEGFFGTTITLNLAINEYDENGVHLNSGKEGKKPVTIQEVEFTVEPGTVEQTVIKIDNKGCRCGDRVGNVILLINPQQSPRYKVDPKGNVHSKVKVPLNTLLTGGVVEVPTMYGIKTIKVPPGTAPVSDEFNIENCGVSERGRHVVTFEVPDFPSKEDLKEKEEWVNFKPDFDIDDADKVIKGDREMEDRFLRMMSHTFPGGFASHTSTSTGF